MKTINREKDEKIIYRIMDESAAVSGCQSHGYALTLNELMHISKLDKFSAISIAFDYGYRKGHLATVNGEYTEKEAYSKADKEALEYLLEVNR